MDEREVLKEKFKSAISSAIKVISEKFDVEINFGNNNDTKKNSLNLPELINLKTIQDFTNLIFTKDVIFILGGIIMEIQFLLIL